MQSTCILSKFEKENVMLKIYVMGTALLGAMVVLSGCSSGKSGSDNNNNSGPQPQASTVKDMQKKIDSDPLLKGAKITVKLDAGTLSLEGTVSKIDQKNQAEKDIADIQQAQKMVPGVYDNLMVEGK
jgi:hypothetical protein